jgi:hypothetical protein
MKKPNLTQITGEIFSIDYSNLPKRIHTSITINLVDEDNKIRNVSCTIAGSAAIDLVRKFDRGDEIEMIGEKKLLIFGEGYGLNGFSIHKIWKFKNNRKTLVKRRAE